jgi:flagellar biosynthesis/type III secretory pathway M-ring protein FliF/YscJ
MKHRLLVISAAVVALAVIVVAAVFAMRTIHLRPLFSRTERPTHQSVAERYPHSLKAEIRGGSSLG